MDAFSELLNVAKRAYIELSDRYSVDQPEPGLYVESPFIGISALIADLKHAIDRFDRNQRQDNARLGAMENQ